MSPNIALGVVEPLAVLLCRPNLALAQQEGQVTKVSRKRRELRTRPDQCCGVIGRPLTVHQDPHTAAKAGNVGAGCQACLPRQSNDQASLTPLHPQRKTRAWLASTKVVWNCGREARFAPQFCCEHGPDKV